MGWNLTSFTITHFGLIEKYTRIKASLIEHLMAAVKRFNARLDGLFILIVIS